MCELSEVELYHILTSFRQAIKEAVNSGDLFDMKSFPFECCSYTSSLLQRYLIEEYGYFTWYMSGEYDNNGDFDSHAWLENIDHSLVLDITGDQFRYKRLKFTKSVYIGSRNNGFHNMFTLHEPVSYSFSNNPLDIDIKAEERYETIKRFLDI